jgi:hypothetical protein
MTNAQARYRYDPHRELIAVAWALAGGFQMGHLARYFPRWLAIAAIFGFAGLGVLIALRRYAFPRVLILDEDGAWIPSGFMRMHARRIVFAETSAIWEVFLPLTAVLCLRYRGKTFEIVSTLLPDHESYVAVGCYICSRVKGGRRV